MEWMNRLEITEQVERLLERAKNNNTNSDDPIRRERAVKLTNEANLLKYAADNATDEELRLAQIVLPGENQLLSGQNGELQGCRIYTNKIKEAK